MMPPRILTDGAPRLSRRGLLGGALLALPILSACGRSDGDTAPDIMLRIERAGALYAGIAALGPLAYISSYWEYPPEEGEDALSELAGKIFDGETMLAEIRRQMPAPEGSDPSFSDAAGRYSAALDLALRCGRGDRRAVIASVGDKAPDRLARAEQLARRMALPRLAAEQALAGVRMARMLWLRVTPGLDEVARLDAAGKAALADRIIQESRAAPNEPVVDTTAFAPSLAGLAPNAARDTAHHRVVAALATLPDATLATLDRHYASEAGTAFTRLLGDGFARQNDADGRRMILEFLKSLPA